MIRTAKELAAACKDAALNHKTLYVMGCFGAPMNESNKKRYTRNNSYNTDPARTAMINGATSDTFGFDCVCLIKGILWGWSGDPSLIYGGATYKSNNVPDIGADSMIGVCSDVSTDFSDIQIGEAVWMKGHIGVYIGDGLAVECTPKWDNCVQITAVHNIGTKPGYNGRKWTKHGKLPYVEYVVETVETPEETVPEVVIGEIVTFTGSRHYISANSGTGRACAPGTAKVTKIEEGTQHPYHLIKQPGGGSTVYGWVDAADIEDLQPATPDPEPPAKPCDLSLPTLRNGSKGETVRALQILLIGNNCSCGSYGADCEFGTATENAVMMYQDRNGLTVDGICGSKTWTKLLGL